MRKTLAALVALAILLPASAAAITKIGITNPDTMRVWGITHNAGGQLVLTLYFKKKASMLYLVMACDDGTTLVSGSAEQRFQRAEVGVLPDTVCEIGVTSMSGASKFWLNIQATVPPNSDAQMAVVSMPGGPSPRLQALAREYRAQRRPAP